MKDCWKHWLKSYLTCMNDCSDPKRTDDLFDSTKVFMPYFDQVYVETCFGQVWEIVDCKLLQVFLLVTCKSVGLNWRIERNHVLLLFYLSCKLKRVGRLYDVKQLFWKPAMIRTVLNFLWDTRWTTFEGHWCVNLTNQKTIIHVLCTCKFLENFACDRFAIQNIYQCNFSKDALEVF